MKYTLIVLFLFLTSCLLSQKRFNFEFGIGSNYSSAIMKWKYYENTSGIAKSFSIHGRLGITTRLGIKYKVVKNLSIKTNISYNLLKYKYNTIVHPSLTEPERGIFISKIRSNVAGISLGIEYFLFKKLSISGFITYSKNLKRKTYLDMHWELEWNPYYRYKDVEIEDTKSEKSTSMEFAYYYRKFSFNPGFEYTFTKQPLCPTENTGYRYKIYFVVSYFVPLAKKRATHGT